MMPTRTRAGERTPMRSALWRAIPLVLVLILALAGCSGPTRGDTQPSAASGLNLMVVASPNVLRAGTTAAGGSTTGGCAIVQVNVFNTNGQLVTGAPVTMTSTLGEFQTTSPGPTVVGFISTTTTAGSAGTTTAQGVFTSVLCAGTVTGTAIVTASVENAFATTNITIF